MDHLVTTINTSASRRHTAVLASPSPELGKAYRSRQIENRRAKAPKNQRTRTAAITNNDNRRSEETDLKLHQQLPKPNRLKRTFHIDGVFTGTDLILQFTVNSVHTHVPVTCM
jgi:hypothetical protein